MTDFTFIALYNNGDKKTLSDTFSYDDLVREGLRSFQVLIGNSVLFTLHLEKGQKLIYRKRGFTEAGVDPSKSKEPVIYLVGWRQNVGGQDIQSITYICDWIGRGFQLHQAGKFKDDHPWFYSPTFQEHEALSGEKYQKDGIWKTK